MADLTKFTASGKRVLIYTILIVFAIYFMLPLFVMLSTSVKTLADIQTGNLISLPSEISFSAWSEAWQSACIGAKCGGIKQYFFNSILIVVPAVLLSTVLGALNGYVITQWRFPGSEIFFGALLVGSFIPFQVVLLPMAQLLGMLNLGQSLFGLILVHTVYGLAFTTLFFRNFYISVPKALVAAAKIDGAGFFKIFIRIMLPISLPTIMVTIIWQTTQIWNDFLFGVVFSTGDTQPVTVALNNIVNTTSAVKRYNVDMASAIIAAIPTLLVYFVSGKYFIRGLTVGSVKG